MYPSISFRHDVPWRYYWHFVLPRSIHSLARFFPITFRSPATTRSYVCYSDSTQRVSERAVTLPVPVLPIARLLIRRGIPPGRQGYIFNLRDDCTPGTYTAVSTLCDETAIEDRTLTCFVRETGCTSRYLSLPPPLPPPLTFSKAYTFVIRLCYPAHYCRTGY